ncbi:hypothetical protein [Mucilaginibacter polytrichastri]|uniref:Uncharacterized protein n=1 Tax=Mucilaginibacter polytrichastri TaxID=1302689 RepID=A0A1Q6A363_9SPHI|nr:hypothetical protein [Mucilaginibacter polytrichastri]OKS88431.1 hypothetical protein RG47T_3898 [Mucilaginibacter polytrichastri]SFT14495.1 hypothetical protein SAMN04487890_112159 [Mucilaginibacter polytrichastri]
MATENPALLHYFLQDDLYLLSEDKSVYNGQALQPAITPIEAPVLQAIETPKQQVAIPVAQTPKPDFKYLGANKKRFLILVNYPADEHMLADHLSKLESTLGRKTLLMDDVAIVNTAHYVHNNHQELVAFFSPEKLLILGAPAIPAGLASPKLNSIEQLDNRLQLFTHSFNEMLADREMAKAFWEQMKNL